MISSLSDRVLLNNGTKIPGLGLGVFQIPDSQTAQVVKEGIENGYRLIDTAQIYGNETGTGQGIKEGIASTGLTREDIFVTSKIWNSYITKEEALKAIDMSLNKLQLDYLDLLLIHWPGINGAYRESWKALEEAYATGKIKAIGVSNFTIKHLEDLAQFAKVKPVINQVELHPKLAQNELLEYSKTRDIKLQAWSPLMQGQLLDNAVITDIAQKHHKSPAQVILRWDIQRDILLVVKSVHKQRMLNNADIFDFTLDADDMKRLSNLDAGLRNGPHPDEFDFKL